MTRLPIAAALAALSLAACGPSPSERAFEGARERVRLELRDPMSAQFSGEKLTESGAVCGFVNAKNGFGGYVGNRAYVAERGKLARVLSLDDVPSDFWSVWNAAGCAQVPLPR